MMKIIHTITAGDVLIVYVGVLFITGVIAVCYEAILYDESKIKEFDIIWVISVSLFWPIYAIKYGPKGIVAVFNRLIYDVIH